MFENPGRGRQARNFRNKCSENSRSQIVFRTDIFPKIDVWVPLRCSDPVVSIDDFKKGFTASYTRYVAPNSFFQVYSKMCTDPNFSSVIAQTSKIV